MSKPTPGPWVVGETIDMRTNWPVFRLRDMANPADREEVEADRRLIEAAPDLLEACQLVQSALVSYRDRLAEMGCESWIGSDVDAAVAAAIAKATGESP